jgi:hypothetical protein
MLFSLIAMSDKKLNLVWQDKAGCGFRIKQERSTPEAYEIMCHEQKPRPCALTKEKELDTTTFFFDCCCLLLKDIFISK